MNDHELDELLRRAFPGIRPATDDELDDLAARDLAAWNRFIYEHSDATDTRTGEDSSR